MIGRGRGRLDDENIFAAHVLLNLYKRFAIGKRGDGALAKFAADGFANGVGEWLIGGAAKNFHR